MSEKGRHHQGAEEDESPGFLNQIKADTMNARRRTRACSCTSRDSSCSTTSCSTVSS